MQIVFPTTLVHNSRLTTKVKNIYSLTLNAIGSTDLGTNSIIIILKHVKLWTLMIRMQTQFNVGLLCIIFMKCLLLLTHDNMQTHNSPNNPNILVIGVLEVYSILLYLNLLVTYISSWSFDGEHLLNLDKL
jgi:hypothetical protein